MKCFKHSPKWKLNYIIVYRNIDSAKWHRHLIHDALVSVALLQKIDFAFDEDFPFFDESQYKADPTLKELVVDIAYFRSNINSHSGIKAFRQIVDGLFYGYDIVLEDSPFHVYSMGTKYMSEYPFPQDFERPLNYPYVEHHEGKETTLCVTAASYDNLLNEENNKDLN